MRKTSIRQAPWHLIPANDKPQGRLAALRIMVDRLSKCAAGSASARSESARSSGIAIGSLRSGKWFTVQEEFASLGVNLALPTEFPRGCPHDLRSVRRG